LACPGPSHIVAAKRILRYLAGTPDYSIRYVRNSVPEANTIRGFVDADHAGDPHTRISVSGYIMYCNGGPISWSSKRQPIVALSSSEAEFYAASLAGCEVEYLRRIFEGLGFRQQKPTVVYEDNQGTIYMSRAAGSFSRSKHIDTRVFRLRSLCAAGILELVKIDTKHNVADIFTKGLAGPLFEWFRGSFLFMP